MEDSKPRIGIIGGSGLYELIKNPKHVVLETPFGKTPRIEIGEIGGVKIAFLNRHGKPGVDAKVQHSIPPSKINYRANVYGLRKLGVERLIVTNACGSLNEKIKPGDIVLPDQFMDFTKQRINTFFDGETPVKVWPDKPPLKAVVHVDMSHPYCPELIDILAGVCKDKRLKFHKGGVYVCTEGPRFETPAEIKFYKSVGGDVVGMTSVPEVILAKELTMCYASLSVATNWAAGISSGKVTHEEVLKLFSERMKDIREVIEEAIKRIPVEKDCSCRFSLEGAY